MRRNLAPAIVTLFSLAVLVVLAVLGGSSGTSDADPSSRAAGKHGSLALYLWLQQLGLDVQRVSGSFDLQNTDVLVVYAPTVAVDSDAQAAVKQLLDGGGDVILALDPADPRPASGLLQLAGVHLAASTTATDAHVVQPLDPAASVRHVPLSGDEFALRGGVPLLDVPEGDVAVAVRPAGAGRMYVLGDAQPLSNDGLRHDDSAAFVLALLERSRGGRIGIDEYHHGEVSSAGASSIIGGPVGLAALLALLSTGAWLLISGRRLGRPVPVEAAWQVPSVRRYLGAMAQLFQASRQRGGVADRYADELKRCVALATGIDAHLDDDTFVQALHGYGEERVQLVEAALRRARELAASSPSEAMLLQLAQQVEQAEQRFAAGAAA